MKINLNNIKASPKPIRTSWDEEKLKELQWSLMEEGQVEPIGVHKSGDDYVLVWGHRRVEAARRAGWNEIEAVIVDEEESNNLIQAGIENLAGEDMSADDKAEWAFRLTELGLSQREIERRSCIGTGAVSTWLMYRKEKLTGVEVQTGLRSSQDEGIKKTIAIAQVLGDDLQAKKTVAHKVSQDRLNRDQTRAVAEAYRDAPTPEVKQQILKTPIISKDTSADILRRSINKVEMDTGIKIQKDRNDWDKEREEKNVYDSFDADLKSYLDDMRLFNQRVKSQISLLKFSKLSPEAIEFTIRKIDNLIGDLKTYKENLGEIK